MSFYEDAYGMLNNLSKYPLSEMIEFHSTLKRIILIRHNVELGNRFLLELFDDYLQVTIFTVDIKVGFFQKDVFRIEAEILKADDPIKMAQSYVGSEA